MDNQIKKKRIRQEMKELRNGLDVFSIKVLSEKVFENLKSFSLDKMRVFFVYNSFGSEVMTDKIVEYLLDNGKCVYMPKVKGDQMFSLKICKETEFIKNAFGVFEPVGEPEEIDDFVAVMPCLAVDKFGNRIGYGKGYYDRFLKNKTAKKIAICFDFQIIDELPFEEFDVRLDYIASDRKILKIQSQKLRTK